MHDEAGTHYVAMIDQTTLGHQVLLEEFGAIPKVGWQIDPFGHSSTQAALLSARVGFEGLFFARIDYQDSQKRNTEKGFEMIWRPSPSLGTRGQVFTGAFERNGYGPPNGFNWNTGSGDAPIQDDPQLEDYNVKSRVQDFVNVAMDQFSANVGNDIMFTLGSDFQYSNADTWYKNLDKLIDYVNADGRLNIFYSTPSRYVDAKKTYPITWPVKTDDFFPYADCPHCYWTGYFTSRTALKRNVRVHSGYLNSARKLEFIGAGDGSQTVDLARGLGVAQHHDGVSGTSKQHVAYDYALGINKGVLKARAMVNDVLGKLVWKGVGEKPKYEQCDRLNQTTCSFTESQKSFSVVIFNPMGQSREELVRLPVGSSSYVVYDSNGLVVPSQTIPSFVPFATTKPAPYVLNFHASIPALGFNTYFVQVSTSAADTATPSKVFVPSPHATTSIENNLVKVSFTNGKLFSITNKQTGVVTPTNHSYLYYDAYGVSNHQNSGAYIFRPKSNQTTPVCTTPSITQVVIGGVVQEVRIMCGWIAETVRITGQDPVVEFEYQLNSVPIDDGIGKEVISSFGTNIKSGGVSYTDSNGREFQKRIRNYRPTWKLQVTEPIAGNYYPVNAATFIQDTETQFSIVTDRSQGGASIVDGQLELMIQRRLLFDDSRGVGEPLNETDGITPYPNPVRLGKGIRVTGSHYVYVGKSSDSLRLVRNYQLRIFSSPVLGFTPIGQGIPAVKQWIRDHVVTNSQLKSEIPENLDIMTLQSNPNGVSFLRLAHQFGIGEDSELSNPVTIDLETIFGNISLSDLKEVSLTANQVITPEFEKGTQWKVSSEDGKRNSDIFEFIPLQGKVVTINPMDIRTFSFKAV
eukprot:TRINITY_DN4611_c0_g2_i1.p1 TRINITY_DN4611_c0_g2~~TRINITY_DN4611_c0_g2_i1.p1  ORF type:complete len:1005 (-),score=211.24 TRINITY_DN4611_c0_g2_i1:125-2698(-)